MDAAEAVVPPPSAGVASTPAALQPAYSFRGLGGMGGAMPAPSSALAPLPSSRLPAYSNPYGNRRRDISSYRPFGGDFKRYLDALSGPSQRTPLVYTGDPMSALDSLHKDVVSHYRDISSALGEPERRDLTDPTSYFGLGLGGPGSGLGRLGSSPLMLPPAPLPSSIGALAVSPYISGSYIGASGRSLMPSFSSGGALVGASSHFHSAHPGPAISAGGAWGPSGPGAMRASGFTTTVAEPDSLLGAASSQLMYPPVGSTFEGGPSRSVQMFREAKGIDTLADLTFQKKRVNQLDEMLSDVTKTTRLPSEKRGPKDQLDTFLSDFMNNQASAPAANLPLSGGGARHSYKDGFAV